MKPRAKAPSRCNSNLPIDSPPNSPIDSTDKSPPNSPSNGYTPYDGGDSSLSSRSPPHSFSAVAVVDADEPIHPPLVSNPPRPTTLSICHCVIDLFLSFFHQLLRLATELVIGYTVVLYDNDRPPSDDEEQPPGLTPGDEDDEDDDDDDADDAADMDDMDDKDDTEVLQNLQPQDEDVEGSVEKDKWAHLSRKCKSYTWK